MVMIGGTTGGIALAALASALAHAPSMAAETAAPADAAARCAALGARMDGHWPETGTRITRAVFQAAGPVAMPPGMPAPPGPPTPLPAHCEVEGIMHERTGVDGQHYAIRFHMRLPADWNGRFLFEGGGGTNGNLGLAIGMAGFSAPPALARGFAVLSQDSGHDNATNSPPGKGGAVAFGLDPQARADYGGASLRPVTLAAQALIRAYYGQAPRHSYFFGCSKGGQEGMMLAQRDPDLYDGIVAGAPGFSLPRAAIGEVWNIQAFAGVVRAAGQPVTPGAIAASFSDADLGLVRTAVLAACDAQDGARDGMILDAAMCTSAKVLPRLNALACADGRKSDACLGRPQIEALVRIHDGAKDGEGRQLYPGFPWDAGWADMGWRIWMTGSADGRIPAINIAMGAPALAAIFTTPPTVPGPAPQDALDYALGFDMSRDAARIDAVAPPFQRSAWQDIGARSIDLDAFRARGGRLIVPHGVSDPVFSIDDTLAWYREVDARYDGTAGNFVRVFPVPGMNHCAGGPATDQYDMLAVLMDWVEQGKAPDAVAARAGPMSPWPGRERPLCPYPAVARSSDGGGHFACVTPRSGTD